MSVAISFAVFAYQGIGPHRRLEFAGAWRVITYLVGKAMLPTGLELGQGIKTWRTPVATARPTSLTGFATSFLHVAHTPPWLLLTC